MKNWPAVTVALIVLAAVIGFAVWAFSLSGVTGPRSVHGWVALILGLAGVAGLTGGLMWLAFYSSRKGFDDRQ